MHSHSSDGPPDLHGLWLRRPLLALRRRCGLAVRRRLLPDLQALVHLLPVLRLQLRRRYHFVVQHHEDFVIRSRFFSFSLSFHSFSSLYLSFARFFFFFVAIIGSHVSVFAQRLLDPQVDLVLVVAGALRVLLGGLVDPLAQREGREVVLVQRRRNEVVLEQFVQWEV